MLARGASSPFARRPFGLSFLRAIRHTRWGSPFYRVSWAICGGQAPLRRCLAPRQMRAPSEIHRYILSSARYPSRLANGYAGRVILPSTILVCGNTSPVHGVSSAAVNTRPIGGIPRDGPDSCPWLSKLAVCLHTITAAPSAQRRHQPRGRRLGIDLATTHRATGVANVAMLCRRHPK